MRNPISKLVRGGMMLGVGPLIFMGSIGGCDQGIGEPTGSVAQSEWKLTQSSSFGRCVGKKVAQGATFTSTWTVPCQNSQVGKCVLATRTTGPTQGTFTCS